MWVYIGLWGSSRLPSGYQEVEYIQSSWTQRIDTGITPDDATYGFEIKFNPTAASWDWSVINLWGTTGQRYMYWVQAYYANDWQVMAPFEYDGWTSWSWVSPATNTDFVMKYNLNWNLKLDLNGTEMTMHSAGSAYTMPNFNIFCTTTPSSYIRSGSFKLYYCKMYKGTTLLRDFVPCYRTSDDEIWLYDLVNDVFYANSWSWTFTKWADVTTVDYAELYDAYIGGPDVPPTPVFPIPTDGLLGYWPFETDGTDESWNWNDATVTGCTFWTVWGKNGVQLETTRVNNPSNYIISSLDYNSLPVTAICWMYPTNLNDWQNAMGNTSQTSHPDSINNIRIRFGNSELRIAKYGSELQTWITFSNNQWKMVAIAIDSSNNGILYIDWQQSATFTAWGNNSSTWPWAWGHWENRSSFHCFVWWIRQSALYNKALSAAEVLEYYNWTNS